MTNTISISIDARRAQAAFARAPQVMVRAIDVKLARGAEEVARTAKRGAPKLFSTLINSIRAQRIGALHYEVSSGVNYARSVEEGTGPAVGKARYFPNVESLQQYLMHAPSYRRFNLKRAGSRGRSDQEMDTVWRAKAWAWYIYNHGTKPQPYMQPAADASRSRLFELVQQGVDEGIKEVFG